MVYLGCVKINFFFQTFNSNNKSKSREKRVQEFTRSSLQRKKIKDYKKEKKKTQNNREHAGANIHVHKKEV